MKQVKVGIINVTGYVGMELARLLQRHPGVRLSSITGRSAVGQKLGELLPHLADIDLMIQPHLGDVDLVFSALPHKTSAEALLHWFCERAKFPEFDDKDNGDDEDDSLDLYFKDAEWSDEYLAQNLEILCEPIPV